MDNFSGRFLSAVSCFIEKTTFVNSLTNLVFDTLIPKKSARAKCWTTGWFCYQSSCGAYCGEDNFPGYKVCYYWETLWYDPYDSNCEQYHMRSCIDPCKEGCWETVPLGTPCPL